MENRGLSEAEAARLLKEHGRNELPSGKKHRLVSIIAGQFKDCMVIVLIAAAVVSAFLECHREFQREALALPESA